MLDRWNSLGYPLIMAGHTHGGQLCLPFFGALVTNCDLDRKRAKGLHTHQVDGHDSVVAARVGRARHVAVHARTFCLPPRGDSAHPD